MCSSQNQSQDQDPNWVMGSALYPHGGGSEGSEIPALGKRVPGGRIALLGEEEACTDTLPPQTAITVTTVAAEVPIPTLIQGSLGDEYLSFSGVTIAPHFPSENRTLWSVSEAEASGSEMLPKA